VVTRVARPNGKAAKSPKVPMTVASTIQLAVTAPRESGIRIDYFGKLSVRSILRKLQPRMQRLLDQFYCGIKEDQANNLVSARPLPSLHPSLLSSSGLNTAD
jgi:hypothetical protein